MFYKKYIKRFFDFMLCSIALIFFSPLMIITAIAIKISSPGPAIYQSYRIGKNKKPFLFYKFRSMHIANEKDKSLFVVDDNRVFAVGKIIRKYKIDELPQLINVIKGDMSIVGPRPMIAFDKSDIYSGKYKSINDIKPGLTSAASLYDYTIGETYSDNDKYRKEVLPKKLKLELLYLEKEGFSYDAKLIWRTVLTIICMAFKRTDRLPFIPELKDIDF